MSLISFPFLFFFPFRAKIQNWQKILFEKLFRTIRNRCKIIFSLFSLSWSSTHIMITYGHSLVQESNSSDGTFFDYERGFQNVPRCYDLWRWNLTSSYHFCCVVSSSILIWPDLISSLLSASVQFSSYLNTLLLFSPNLISSLIFCFVLISFEFFLFLFTYFIFSPSVSSLSHSLCLVTLSVTVSHSLNAVFSFTTGRPSR